MINIGKAAVLGAILAVSAPFASALSFTGDIAPAGAGTFTCSGSPVSCAFAYTGNTSTASVLTSSGTLGIFDYHSSGGVDSITFGNFTATATTLTVINPVVSITATNNVIATLSGGNPTDTLSFNATGVIPNTLIPVGANIGGQYSPAGSVLIVGTLSDSLGLFTTVNAQLAFAENGGEITFTEDELVPTGSPTPEPNSLVLLGTGLVSAAGMLVRRRRVA